MKVLWLALALLAGLSAVAIAALFSAVVVAGPTVAGGERAVLLVLVIDTLGALLAAAWLWRGSRALRPAARVLALCVFLVAEAVLLASMLLLTLVALNR